jgi:glycosyltransferase involved in cell wall biosynthesis
MAAGRPVLFAADAANQPVQEADCGRTVAPEDPEALAQAIRSLAATSQAERARLGANARAYVSERHDYARLADRLAEVLLGS